MPFIYEYRTEIQNRSSESMNQKPSANSLYIINSNPSINHFSNKNQSNEKIDFDKFADYWITNQKHIFLKIAEIFMSKMELCENGVVPLDDLRGFLSK